MNQTQEQILGENRNFGWPDVSTALASPSRSKFAAKIAEFRRRALTNPAEYRSRCEREERSALATHVRKVNPLPAPMLTDHELKRKAVILGWQIELALSRAIPDF